MARSSYPPADRYFIFFIDPGPALFGAGHRRLRCAPEPGLDTAAQALAVALLRP